MTRALVRFRGHWTDLAGTSASTLCALHCTTVAMAPGVLAAAGLASLLSHETEWLFVGTAAALGVSAAWLGYGNHRRPFILWWLHVSAAGLIASLLLELVEFPGGVVIGVLSGLLLALGHLKNLRAVRRRADG